MSSVSGGGGAGVVSAPPGALFVRDNANPTTKNMNLDTKQVAVSTRAVSGVEGALVEQVAVTGEGVLTFAGFNGQAGAAELQAVIEIDGVEVYDVICQGDSYIYDTIQMVGGLGCAGPLAFATGFRLLTRETVNGGSFNSVIRYQYRLTA